MNIVKAARMTETEKSEQEPGIAFDLHAATQDAIDACGGDLLATVRSLVIANNFLYSELERFKSLCSPGFARGKSTLRDLP